MKVLFSVILILFFYGARAQNSVEELVREGIKYHDSGDYDQAISTYLKALLIDGESWLANYEISMTYFTKGDYEKALKHAEKVISTASRPEALIPAYISKGNSLDEMGRSQEAVEAYKVAIKNVGAHYLLSYNLALAQYKIGNTDEAEKSLIEALANNQQHAGSHLLLGYVMKDRGNKTQSLLSLYYFLLLEPGSGRSKQAFEVLREQLYGSVKRTGPTDFSIFIDPSASEKKKNEFGSADMMIGMLVAANASATSSDRSEGQLFVENTTSLFSVVGETKKKKYKGLWWEFYVPFFYDLARSPHIEPYCYYISQSVDSAAADWLESNGEKLDAWDKWMKEH